MTARRGPSTRRSESATARCCRRAPRGAACAAQQRPGPAFADCRVGAGAKSAIPWGLAGVECRGDRIETCVRTSQLILRNTLRAPVRTLMTVLTVAIMISAFVFPRALVGAQRRRIDQAEANRVVVQPRRGWGSQLPARYADQIRE